MSASPLPPMGDPGAVTCQHCRAGRVALRSKTGAVAGLVCRTCDSPEVLGKHVTATWDRS